MLVGYLACQRDFCGVVWIFDVFNNYCEPFQELGIQFLLEVDLQPNMQLMKGIFNLQLTGPKCGLVGYKQWALWSLESLFIHLGEEEVVEEKILGRASSFGLGNKEIAWWACKHKFRSSLEVPTSVWEHHHINLLKNSQNFKLN